MTASSVELLSSCRVQLVGLPQSAATNSSVIAVSSGVDGSGSSIIRQNNTMLTLPPREPTVVTAPRLVSRNLFGSPQPGEVRELLHKETLQKRSYFLKRYNVDILNPTESADVSTKMTYTINEPVHHHQLPSLIAEELLNHEKKLLQEADAEVGGEECNLSRAPNSELPSTLISCGSNSSSSRLKKSGQVRRTVAATAVISSDAVGETVDNTAPVLVTQNSASDRLKPYTRQTLITDWYSQRKMSHTNVDNNRAAISMIGNSQQQQLNIMRLPKPVNSVLSSTSIPISSSATNRDSVQADYTISLTIEATIEQQGQQQPQSV